MNQRAVIIGLFGIAVALAWWAGRFAAGGGPVIPAPVAAAKRAGPALPVPRVLPLLAVEESKPSPVPGNELLQKILLQGAPAVRLEQLQEYLRQNKRSAESLIAASRLTNDLTLLREAAQRYPNDPMVHFELAMRSDNAAEKQQAIESLAATAPDNSLGPYLAADAAFKAGKSNDAVRYLSDAANRLSMSDYGLETLQAVEDAYIAAGYQPVEAKAAAAFGQRFDHASQLRELGRQMSAIADAYSSAGDSASVQALMDMGIALGQRVQLSMGRTAIGELLGSAIESRFLKGQDPGAVINGDGLTVQQRQEQLAARKDLIKTSVQGIDPGDPNLSPQLLSQYLDRQKTLGELPALQWLRARLGLTTP